MHHMGGNPIHEITVVRDEQQGAGVATQPVLQPQAGIKIQVVGRLIQKQQIGRPHQGLRQIQPDPPATGKCRHRSVGVLVREAQPTQQRLRPACCRPGLVHIELSVYAGNGMVIPGRFRPGKLGFQAAQIQIAIQDKIPGTPVGCLDFLCHVGNAATTGQ